MRVGPTRLFEDGRDHVVQVVVRVGVVEPFRKPVDEDARIRCVDHHLRVGPVVVGDGEKEVPCAVVGVASVHISTRGLGAPFRIVAGEMVADDRMHLDFAQEPPSRFHGPEQQHRHRHPHGRVDAVLDAGEHRDEHADEKDEDLPGRDAPKLKQRVRRRDEVSDRMDDDGRQGRAGDVEKHGRERIDGEEHHESRDDPGKRGSDAGLGLDGRARKRSRGRICPQEGPEQVRDPDGDHLLRGIDGVIVDATKRFGNRNVLDQQHDHRDGNIPGKGFDDGLVHRRDGRILEACGTVNHAGVGGDREAWSVPRGTSPSSLKRHCFLPR